MLDGTPTYKSADSDNCLLWYGKRPIAAEEIAAEELWYYEPPQ